MGITQECARQQNLQCQVTSLQVTACLINVASPGESGWQEVGGNGIYVSESRGQLHLDGYIQVAAAGKTKI